MSLKRFLSKMRNKKKLIDAFKLARIYLGDEKHYIFPKIHNVTSDSHSTKITFSLPAGLDPKLIKKNYFVFQQKFGNNIEMEGEIKTFVLTVHSSILPTVLPYEYERYREHLEGLKLPILSGIDSNKNIIVYDMVKNPHLLIAGETGSGKSTQLRSVLSTLIQALPPNRLELFLCDLKRSEFHLFRHIEHVKGLFHSAREMMPMLQYLKKEMQSRGDLLDFNEVSHIDDLQEPHPYIVLCIDEVALLQDEKDLMKLIEEISAIGRALGVFLILSMQRPDAQVLNGKLKNNLTVRMGFKCADLINSRIIGTPGSEKLKHEGRLLLKLPQFSEPREIQAPYLSLETAKKILETYKYRNPKNENSGYSVHSDEVMKIENKENSIFGVLDECENEI